MIKTKKGYTKLKGKIWGINRAEIKKNDYTSKLGFGLQTAKDNSIFVNLEAWNNSKNVAIMRDGQFTLIPFAEKDNLLEGDKLLGVTMKYSEDMNNITLVDIEALPEIKNNFKDGQTVFIKCNIQADDYTKGFKNNIQQIYISSEELDFKSDDFTETNDSTVEVILLDKSDAKNGIIIVGATDSRDKLVEIELTLKDEDVINFFTSTAKKGDLLKLQLKMVHKPKYKKVDDDTQEQKEDSKPSLIKGKIQTKHNNFKFVQDGHEDYIEVIDCLSREEQKYSSSEIQEALYGDNSGIVENENSNDDEEDLPF